MTDIANREGISTSTVIRVDRKFARYLENGVKHLLCTLCFDEFASTKQANVGMSFIMMDSLTHEVLDSRQQSALLTYFYRYPHAVRNRAKHIVIDMYDHYTGLIKTCFPNTKIIIDRFHISQHLNRVFNRQMMNVCKTSRTTVGSYGSIVKQSLILQNEYGDLVLHAE